VALSIPTIGKKKPVTLQAEQQQVAMPTVLKAPAAKQPPKPAVPPPPSPPRETAPTPPTTYGAPLPPGAIQPAAPNQRPTQPGAGQPAVGIYDVPTPSKPAAPETLPMTMDTGVAEVIGANAPQPPAPPPSDTEFDAQVRQLMADLLAGKGMDVSTAEEEALIRELMQDRLGAGLVEQRARMGRSGFGASGALAAMEGDIRRQAGQQATQETLAIRRQAEQEAIDNALRAIGVDVEKRAEGRQAMFDEEFLNALRSYLGQEDTGAPAGSTDVFGSLFPEPENPLSTNNPAATKVDGNSVLDPVTKQPYEIRASPNPNDVKRRVLVDANGNSYAIYLDSEKSSPGTNVLYAVKV
jgi:type II secretory pathway pseudopilin PulG